MKYFAFILIFLTAPPVTAQDGAALPEWFQEHVEYLSADGGRWVADNSEYASEQETSSHYVIIFTQEFGGASMRGNLFGIVDGEQTVDFWQFRTFWDPVAGDAIMSQYGWGGAYGSGRVWAEGETHYRSDQVFSGPGQPARREGHLFTVIDDNTHDTTAYEINENGERIEQRTYRWIRET